MKIIALIIGLSFSVCTYAQAPIKKEGEQQSKEESSIVIVPDKKTGFSYKEVNDLIYDIYISKDKKCYILKISKRTGKVYRKYLPPEISEDIVNHLKKEE